MASRTLADRLFVLYVLDTALNADNVHCQATEMPFEGDIDDCRALLPNQVVIDAAYPLHHTLTGELFAGPLSSRLAQTPAQVGVSQ